MLVYFRVKVLCAHIIAEDEKLLLLKLFADIPRAFNVWSITVNFTSPNIKLGIQVKCS